MNSHLTFLITILMTLYIFSLKAASSVKRISLIYFFMILKYFAFKKKKKIFVPGMPRKLLMMKYESR